MQEILTRGRRFYTPRSYLSENPRWRPILPSHVAGTFSMSDLLTFARVDPASRRQ